MRFTYFHLLFAAFVLLSLSFAFTPGCSSGNAASDGGGGSTADMGSVAPDTGYADVGADAGKVCAPMKVIVPDFPSPGSDLAAEGFDYLDRLATDYVCGLPAGATPDDAYFMYGYAPITAFNEIIAGRVGEIKKMRWMLYMSGYFGGVWLHTGLKSSDGGMGGDGGSDGGGMMGGDGGFLNADSIARQAETAAAGTADELFAYNFTSLTEFILPNLGIASNFGYNKGYLLEIVEKPPAGCTPPDKFAVCDTLLWCSYAQNRIGVLKGMQDVSDSLTNSGGRWRGMRDGVQSQPGVKEAQESTETLGHQVWNGILSSEGMQQEFYLRLLDVSASFLEAVQAAGLFAAKGYADKDAAAGRTSAMIQSGLAFWLASYMGSFMGGSTPAQDGGTALPTIVPAQ